LDVNMIVYMVGAFSIAGITTAFFLWSIITKQFAEDPRVKQMPLEEGDEV
jgi:nitrogen fixation-related uncharacterized protein